MHKIVTRRNLILLAIATILLICCSDGERVARVATEATEQQAKQDIEMSKLNREVAGETKGSERLWDVEKLGL